MNLGTSGFLVLAGLSVTTLVACDGGSSLSTAASATTRTIRPDFADALGSPDRVCVDVDHIVATGEPVMVGPDENVPVFDIRSGEILGGNFAAIVGQWSTFEDGGVAKIYWVPLDRNLAVTEALDVLVEPLDTADPSEALTFGGDGSYAQGPGGSFWASGTRFPYPGRYRLTTSAPGHWGCFELTV